MAWRKELATLGHEVQPYCVIIGGGQGGIALGARLKRLGVPTIILEKNETKKEWTVEVKRFVGDAHETVTRRPKQLIFAHRLEQLGARHLRRPLRARRRRHHGAAVVDAHRPLRLADGRRARWPLLRAGGGERHHHRPGGSRLRLHSVQGAPGHPHPRLRRDPATRRGLLRRARQGRLPARSGRRRLRLVSSSTCAAAPATTSTWAPRSSSPTARSSSSPATSTTSRRTAWC